MDNFVYLIKDKVTSRIAVIDPAWDVSAIEQEAARMEGVISDIYLTHSHYDHVNGVDEVLHRHDAQVHLLKEEELFWGRSGKNSRRHHGGDSFFLGDTEVNIKHTPGHTPGSACYHIGNELFTGDTMFVFGCGRCDLSGGDPEVMYKTLKKIASDFDGNTSIRPGHNYGCSACSSLDEQKEGNPFMQHDSSASFVKYRMHLHNRQIPYSSTILQ